MEVNDYYFLYVVLKALKKFYFKKVKKLHYKTNYDHKPHRGQFFSVLHVQQIIKTVQRLWDSATAINF